MRSLSPQADAGYLDAESLAALVELAHDAVLVRGPDSSIVFWNKGAESLYGWSEAEAVGRSSHELLGTRFPCPLPEIERELVDKGGWEGELRHRTKAGGEVVVESRWAPRLGVDGEPVAVMEVNRDVTARAAGELELAAEVARFRAIFESSMDAILLTAPDGRILAANAAAEAMFGRSEEEIIAGGRRLLVDASDPRLAVAIQERQRSGRVRADVRLLRRDGSAFEAAISSVVFADSTGELRTSMVIHDVTEMQQAREVLEEQNERLRELDALKSQFVALVSHELRTPLTSILGHLEVLEASDTERLDERQRRYLAVAVRNANRLRRLVDDLLFVAHADTGTFQLDASAIALAPLAKDVVDALQPAATEAGVTLRVHAAASPMVHADRDRIAQLLNNLLTNALKFTPPAGTIDVCVNASDEAAILAVSDTGAGIDPEDHAHLFERFYRGRRALAGATAGSGLGLAIVKEIVDAHHGTIRVASERGRGSTFTIFLPLVA